MFIPIPIRFGDSREFHTIPVANGLLVALNVFFFVLGWHPYVGSGTGLLSIVTYAFGHVSTWHLAGNMLSLLVFGTPVNRRLGNAWYLIVYFSTVISMGIFARLFCPGPLIGASGAVFSVIAIALILFPSAMIRVAYFALFPVTLITGVISKPAHWVYWIIRWDTFEVRAIWGLVLVPLVEIFGLFWHGVNWSNLGHLSGLICGIIAVLILPASITMNRRSFANYSFN